VVWGTGTDEWRLTIWLHFNNTVFVAEWEAPIIATELYDHRGAARVVMDFDVDGEAENVAGDPANAATIAGTAPLHAAASAVDNHSL
jgi:hypothetical protein